VPAAFVHFDSASTVGLVGAVVASFVAGLSSLAILLRSRAELLKPEISQGTLEERLEELSGSMRQSAKLVQQVEAELDARAATARRLKEEADTAEAIAAIHKDQADAIRRMMDAELTTAAKRIRSDSIKIGILSFVAGGGVTLAVTLLVHPLH
jgi:biopolymer transport protein ExbB/TolQ